MSPNRSSRRGRAHGVLVALLCIAVVGLLGLIVALFQRGTTDESDAAAGRSIPPQKWLELESLKNQGVAMLENALPLESQGPLQALVEQLPGEPLGNRDLAIAAIMAVGLEAKPAAGVNPADAKQERLDRAVTLTQSLIGADPDQVVARVLAARAAKQADRDQEALSHLESATDVDAERPYVWYELYALTRDNPQRAPQNQAALAKALELAPDNLFLIKEMLLVQLAAEDASIVDTLNAMWEHGGFMAEGIRQRVRVEMKDLIDSAIAAVKNDQWRDATRFTRLLVNSVTSQSAPQADQRRIDRDVLEFVLEDFSPATLNRAPSAEQPQPVAVTFKPLPDSAALNELTDVLDLEVADFDLDDKLELVVLRTGTAEVFEQADDGTWARSLQHQVGDGYTRLLLADFDADAPRDALSHVRTNRRSNETSEAPVKDPSPQKPAEVTTVCPAADLDVIVYGPGGCQVLRNDEEGEKRVLNPVEQESEFSALREVLAILPTEADHDGDLDLVISSEAGISIWSNRGNLTFADISSRSMLPPSGMRATGLAAVDWDRDVDLDVIVLSGDPAQQSGYLEGLRHGELRWRSFDAEVQVATANDLVLLDADRRATWRMASAGEAGLHLITARSGSPGSIEVSSTAAILDAPQEGVRSLDYDNDGALDLLSWSSDKLQLFYGDSETFTAAPEALQADYTGVTDAVTVDIDTDGDLDIVLVVADGVQILENQGGNKNNWLSVELRAQAIEEGQQNFSKRVNQYGLGSLIEARSGPYYRARVAQSPTTHFGLGQIVGADSVRVIWTNGVPQHVIDPAANQYICEEQELKGSCPYLYTWDGEKFVFYTDCLWSAPIGLQFAEGVFAPSRAWEYLAISGDKLKPRDGRYSLQITEELWEAGYFDEVQLIAVDHPEDVQIFSNEKVGPAEIAEHKVFTVRHPRSPVAARDQHGQNVLSYVEKQDGEFLKAYERKFAQGLTEPHTLELDLGDLKGAEQVTLYLTGWIFPSDTSLNVAGSQNPTLPKPSPPSLSVPNTGGHWQQVIPYMGFPGGKTKTIAVDLSGKFLTDDFRVKIDTNFEICWDAAFVTVDEASAPYRRTPLKLTDADLHYRGFSRIVSGSGNGPDDYLYSEVSKAPKWPPMQGMFTRYGDVQELVAATDDPMVVMGAGDEMTLNFAAPDEAPPPGWKRDFLLYNVGWDKDADLNTVYGQTAEPLPFNSMSGYPYRADEAYPQTAKHLEYLQRYQTRRQPARAFWSSN